jgi:hypothetical protein
VITSLVLWAGLGIFNEAKAWETIAVRTANELRDALKSIKPGTVLRLAPGEYGSGYHVRDVSDLTIEGTSSNDPPTFTGGNVSIQFSNCSGLSVRHLSIRGQRDNGLNLDDGGGAQRPRGITIEDVSIAEIGPKGNHDGIKCSGLEDLTIRNCELKGWGGQGVDLVGCHKVLISGCTLRGVDGFSASAGIQIKGGSSKVTIEGCTLIEAGERPINAGGSTGADFFRWRLAETFKCEAIASYSSEGCFARISTLDQELRAKPSVSNAINGMPRICRIDQSHVYQRRKNQGCPARIPGSLPHRWPIKPTSRAARSVFEENHDTQEASFTYQEVCSVRPRLRLAKEMGTDLGSSPDVQREVPPHGSHLRKEQNGFEPEDINPNSLHNRLSGAKALYFPSRSSTLDIYG